MTITRRLAVWVPDWPVVAALADAAQPRDAVAVVLRGHRVVAASARARAAGITRGMRQRRVQRLCPDVQCYRDLPARDVRAFEPVAQAIEAVVATIEVTRPGVVMAAADGAERFYAGATHLAEALITHVAEQTGHECQVGIADGLLGAMVAARTASIVPPGGTREFLADHPIASLEYAAIDAQQRVRVRALVDTLTTLGITTLRQLVDLPRADVSARFGATGIWAWTMAQGMDRASVVPRGHAPVITADYRWDEPVVSISHMMPVVEQVAQEFEQRLSEAGVRCSTVLIRAGTVDGQVMERLWRTDVSVRPGAFVAHMTDRIRWQMEGWLSGTRQGPEPSALTSLSVGAHTVVELGAEHQYLWGATSGEDGRAMRAMERVQGLVGVDGVQIAHEQGGRTPQAQVLLMPWGHEPVSAAHPRPWPGALPDPPPATVLRTPEPVMVLDVADQPVQVSRRLMVSAPLTWIRRHRPGSSGWGPPLPVAAWAGPWPMIEHWWSDQAARRAYFQVACADAPALLLSVSQGAWHIEGIYD